MVRLVEAGTPCGGAVKVALGSQDWWRSRAGMVQKIRAFWRGRWSGGTVVFEAVAAVHVVANIAGDRLVAEEAAMAEVGPDPVFGTAPVRRRPAAIELAAVLGTVIWPGLSTGVLQLPCLDDVGTTTTGPVAEAPALAGSSTVHVAVFLVCVDILSAAADAVLYVCAALAAVAAVAAAACWERG